MTWIFSTGTVSTSIRGLDGDDASCRAEASTGSIVIVVNARSKKYVAGIFLIAVAEASDAPSFGVHGTAASSGEPRSSSIARPAVATRSQSSHTFDRRWRRAREL